MKVSIQFITSLIDDIQKIHSFEVPYELDVIINVQNWLSSPEQIKM